MNFVDLKKEDSDLLKTRVETLDLSDELVGKLLFNNIRTIGGLIRPTEADLKKMTMISDIDLSSLRKEIESLISKERLADHTVFINPSIQNNVAEIISEEPKVLLDLEHDNKVVEFLATQLGHSYDEIKGTSRKADIVTARNAIAYLLREYAELSFPLIGKMLGGRDHSTIIHSYISFKEKINNGEISEDSFKKLIERVRELKESNEDNVVVDTNGINIFTYKKPLFKFKEIQEKNIQILDLYRQKIVLRDIAKIYGVTGERVRQIIMATLRQQITNDLLYKNTEINDEILDKEVECQYDLILKSKKKEKIKVEKKHSWSRNYSACKTCGTTSIPHLRYGLCEKCLGGFRGEGREMIISSHQNKCDVCGISRDEAIKTYKRDFYIKKDEEVLCRRCFLRNAGELLGDSRKNKWKKFFVKH
jgi:hypothetical protein